MNNKSIIQILTFLAYFSFLSTTIYAQCPSGDVLLKNQEDVDNFLATYPSCTQINGDLIIASGETNSGCFDCGKPNIIYAGTPITDLTSLAGITSVSGSLVVYANEYLVELDGLENISSVSGDIIITLNFREETIGGTVVNSGLTEAVLGIATVGGNISILQNRSLKRLKGLDNMTNMSGGLAITTSPELDTLELTNLISVGGAFSLSGLSSLEYLGNTPLALTTVGSIFALFDLDSLENVSAFENLTTVSGDFLIGRNEKLQSLANFSSLTEIGGEFLLDDNSNLSSLGGLNINLTGTSLFSNGASIRINQNNSLVNLDAQFNASNKLNQLTISDNLNLNSLDALQGIDSVIFLSVRKNGSLTNIDGLAGLVFIAAAGYIFDNPLLENLDGFSNLNAFGPYLTFYGDFNIVDNPNLTDLTGLCPLFGTGDLDTTLNQSGNGVVLDLTHCTPPVLDPYALLNQLYNAGTISWFQRRVLRRKLNRCHIYSFKLIVNLYRWLGILTQQQADDLIAGAESHCGVTSSSSGAKVGEPTSIFLGQNYPNPTDGVTMIPFTVLANGDVNISLYDATGRLVKEIVNENMMEGENQIKVDLQDLPQGTYFYRMKVGGMVETLPMVKK